MQAIILAAGMGKRLKELTQNNTKCMIKVNGVVLIERMLHQLEKCYLSKIILVTGYEGQKLKDFVAALNISTPIMFVDNPIYDRTNNIYSLALAKNFLLSEDTLLLESDLIFEDDVLDILLKDPRDTLALVDKYESWMDGTCVKIGADDTIEVFIPGKKFIFEDIPDYYKTVNIYKFSRHFSEKYYVPFLEAYSKALGNNEYYEQVLRVITMLDEPEIRAKKLTGQLWYEIDDIQDLDIASSMFAMSSQKKLEAIQSRYGGYWRYPRILDFCYLVNPYFPSQKLMNEMKANFETLLTQYPSGMRVNSLLAAKNFDVRQEHILVGNGAAELIKCLMEYLPGKVGMIRPTFEEYPDRCTAKETCVFVPDQDDFSYTSDNLIQFFNDKAIENLVLINPDNPSGNYIFREDLLNLAAWCETKDIRLIVDESFVDFAEEENASIIHEEVINKFQKLIIVKSVSKSYGVPGIRLGVLVSGDEELVRILKKKVSIWNINSFGEFYMQIEEKYKSDYESSLIKLKSARKEFVSALSTFKQLNVIPSQANFVMVELVDGMSANDLTVRLLQHNILIKDLSTKMGGRQFIRLAVRNKEDNDTLVQSIKNIIK